VFVIGPSVGGFRAFLTEDAELFYVQIVLAERVEDRKERGMRGREGSKTYQDSVPLATHRRSFVRGKTWFEMKRRCRRRSLGRGSWA